MSKGISNIYVKVATERNCCSQNFSFLSLSKVTVGGASTHIYIIEF